LEKGEFVSDTGFSLLAETLEDYLNTVVRWLLEKSMEHTNYTSTNM
jgi:hypothetical protein